MSDAETLPPGGSEAGHAAKKKRTPAELTFLKKLQIVAGFDMDIEKGTSVPANYEGMYVLTSHISGANKKQVEGFLAAEGVQNYGSGKTVKVAAADFYKLEKNYSVPLKEDEIKQAVRRFASGDHSVDFMNSNSAFGLSFSRMTKLLRDHDIPATVQLMDVKITAGDQSPRSVISLSDSANDKLQAALPEIIKAEKAHKAEYDRGVAERAAPKKAAG